MTVRLRPHHLLCLLTYVGKGYTAEFVENYDRIAERLSAGEDILIIDGPDDICEALMGEAEPHCLRDSVRLRDSQAAADLSDFLNGEVSIGLGMLLHTARVDEMRKAFAAGLIRKACQGCEWSTLCNEIAANSYDGVRIRP
jgi:Uncharacterized conserved protein